MICQVVVPSPVADLFARWSCPAWRLANCHVGVAGPLAWTFGNFQDPKLSLVILYTCSFLQHFISAGCVYTCSYNLLAQVLLFLFDFFV